MQRFTTAKLQSRVSSSRQILGSALRLAGGWAQMGDDGRRRSALLQAAQEARALAELLERSAATQPKQEWTMSISRR